MSKGPLCPNCGRQMSFSRTLAPDVGETDDVNVFKCSVCGVSLITEDHLPVAGVRVQGR
jgi:transcription elongation factor Elf1